MSNGQDEPQRLGGVPEDFVPQLPERLGGVPEGFVPMIDAVDMATAPTGNVPGGVLPPYSMHLAPQMRMTPSTSESLRAGYDITTGAPVGRGSSSFAENEALATENYTKRLSEYYGQPVAVRKGDYGLEFLNPENNYRKTLIDEETLTFRDFEDAAAGAITMTGAIVGGGVGLMFGGLGSVAGSGGGAMVADAIRRWSGQALGVREASFEEEAVGAIGVGVLESIFGKTSEFGIRGIQGIRNFFRPRVIDIEKAESITIAMRQDQKVAEEIAERSGRSFQPTTGQLADDPDLLAQQARLRNRPETEEALEARERENRRTLEEWFDELNPASETPDTAVGRQIKLEARDQTQPRIDRERDITDTALRDLETLADEMPVGGNNEIVNITSHTAARARKVVKDEEQRLWEIYKDSIGFDEETFISDHRVPVSGEIKVALNEFAARQRAAIDPSDATGLSALQPEGLMPQTDWVLNQVTGRRTGRTRPASADLWQLELYLRSLKRRARTQRGTEISTDPAGYDIETMIEAITKETEGYLREIDPSGKVLQQIVDARNTTKMLHDTFDKGIVKQLLRRQKGEWTITDTTLVGGVIGSGNRSTMQHMVTAFSHHPAGVPTLQRSFLHYYRSEVIRDGIPNATKHRAFMEKHSEALDVLFPDGGSGIRRLGNFEKAVTQRLRRFERFEANVQRMFRGRIQDISPERVVDGVFQKAFNVKETSQLMRMADAAGVGDAYRAAITSRLKLRFFSPTTGLNAKTMRDFLANQKEKIVATLGSRYHKDMELLTEAVLLVKRTAPAASGTRLETLLMSIAEGATRSTIARPLSRAGVALTRALGFRERAKNMAWAEIIENPDVLRMIIANGNRDINTREGARILGLIGGGYFINQNIVSPDSDETFDLNALLEEQN